MIPSTSVFAKFAVGVVVTRYHEPIKRLKYGTIQDRPAWFDPRQNPAQVAIHNPNGESIFLEVEINSAARAEEHPFDKRLGLNIVSLDQLTLFPVN